MTGKRIALALSAGIAVAAIAAQYVGAVAAKPRAWGVNAARLIGANGEPGAWMSTGRTYDEQRFSPLAQINTANAGKLGLAWYADLDTQRGQEATPLMIDGKLYVTTAWSMVKAYDARTGKLLWSYDPKVPRETLVKACCDAVNRGVAAWGNKLFVGTLDGRLIALDAATGKPVWSKVTVDQSKSYTITGAPRVIKGRVIIGNGGAEYGVRGYITAYDAETGKQLWRFYTVPGDPAAGPEPKYLADAAKTWTGDYWKLGGGGTVWDSMAYDPDLDLLYIGVGNGSPWNQKIRSPQGGDNLYLSSVVALKPETGKYAWHFQETPADSWDYTATQHIVLADLAIGGVKRKVLMHAPKNGFFYVVDRTNGTFIQAKNYAPISWASGVDPKTGRPIVNPDARYALTGKPVVQMPGPSGAHSWHPMAFNPKLGLMYIPAQLAAFPYIPEAGWKAQKLGYNVGVDMAAGAMPADPKVRAEAAAGVKGELIAWDPVAQKARWTVNYPAANNGGVLATAGGLVLQGDAGGHFNVYSATDGKKLWSMPVQTGVMAAPITYSIQGEQYVAVLAGSGGVFSLAPGVVGKQIRNVSRLLVFKIGGKATLPALAPLNRVPLDPPPLTGTAEQVASGGTQFGRYCGACHGDAAVAGPLVPDLRKSAVLSDPATWQAIVHDGALKDNGMVSFAPVMSAGEIEAIRHYVIKRANEDKALVDKGQGEDVK
jgi:alcohol dehydrogenase (cytochrome c)/quinohemoprotein ethanol dehydrogenase